MYVSSYREIAISCYLYVCRADHLGLDNLLVFSSLGMTIPPALSLP